MKFIKKHMKATIFTVLILIIFMFLPGLHIFLINYMKTLLDIINAGVQGADPNWLFATYAQSTAAIVAILGGFIVSRLLSLSAQKNNIKVEIEDISIEMSSKLEEYNIEKEKCIKRNFRNVFNVIQFKKLLKE